LALPLHALLASLASLAVALISFHLFEARFLELKRLFEVGKKPAPAAAQATAAAPESRDVASEPEGIAAPNAQGP
jgi:peptidoglycan/LPS O-acetylase OafA/YrhL